MKSKTYICTSKDGRLFISAKNGTEAIAKANTLMPNTYKAKYYATFDLLVHYINKSEYSKVLDKPIYINW